MRGVIVFDYVKQKLVAFVLAVFMAANVAAQARARGSTLATRVETLQSASARGQVDYLRGDRWE
jgi:hypothetical protein